MVVESLGRWNPGDLAYIDSLDYLSASDDTPSKLRIVARFQRRDTAKLGWPSDIAPFAKVSIEFEGVSKFQIKNLGPHSKQITGFDIQDVSDRGWEGIRFSVGDYEGGQIEFLCEGIRVIAAQPVTEVRQTG